MQNDGIGANYTSPYVPHHTRRDRSSTPAAVQRRRVLNRIAQQNHRRRVKERSKENSAASDSDRDNTKTSTHPPPQSSHDIAKSMDVLGTTTAAPWYGWPQEAPRFGNDANELMFDQDFTKQMKSKCSSAIATPKANPSLHQATQIQMDPSIPVMRPKPALQVPTSSTQTSYSPLERIPSRKSSTNNFHSPPESEPSQKAKRHRGHTPNTTTTSSRNSSAATQFEGNKDTNTTRFQTIIDAVQAAGFESFDAAVSGYYTHAFEKNSAADLAQKTSRARRLAGVMTSLHESSATWTLWEARGYRHQVVEAAESIYSSEVTRLANRRKRKRGHSIAPGRDSRSSSEFEGSSSEFESSTPSTTSTKSGHGSENPRTSLGELQRVYQNKVRTTHPILFRSRYQTTFTNLAK
ncbi:hypothetical protein HO133_001613 [Letharia lupina]|uniref:BZIP domain-containing protein n=1 Tax=Letharia lupina TaxID=560253 RepID=A0A8H6FAW3_9LECA|nr:uncharacterized protein HO133_001613 [Letharia lupina]KAF6221645.1 hypothetical protein HO133_001613 [Letharia lupina]